MKAVVSWTLGFWIVLSVLVAASARADDPLAKPKDAVTRRIGSGCVHELAEPEQEL